MDYTPRTGSIWLRAYDEGIVKKLGGVLGVSGEAANTYYVQFGPSGNCISPNTSTNVPVHFGNPEAIFANKTYPSFSVKRDSFEPNMARWHSQGQMQEMYGIPGTEQVVNGVSGYGQVEVSPQAWPYDITYTVSAYARYEYEAQTLLRNLMKKFPPRSYVTAIDSLGDNRTYECFNDNAVSDLSEIVDVSERVKAYSVTVRVEGEIDLVDPVIVDSVQSIVMTAQKK